MHKKKSYGIVLLDGHSFEKKREGSAFMQKKIVVLLVLINQVFTLNSGTFFKPSIDNTVKDCQPAQTNKRTVVCIMLPKCGTHLLCKCITYFGDPLMRYPYESRILTDETVATLRSLNKLSPPNHYKGRYDIPTVGQMPLFLAEKLEVLPSKLFWTHFSYTREFDQFLDRKNITKFLMMRDPRAMAVSEAFMVQKGYEKSEYIDLEPLLLDLIDGRKKNYIPWGVVVHECYPVIWDMGICAYYKTFLPFMKSKNCVTVRFEDLVGAQGGGSLDVQTKEIQKIAQHVGVEIDLKKAAEIGKELFGGTGTFREGSIDGWKKHFTPAIKAAFKAVPGANQLLIDLGYEKDDQW